MAGEPQWLLTRRVEAAIRKLGVYAQNCQSRSPGDGSELRLRLDACWAALRGELDIASEAMRLLSSEIPALVPFAAHCACLNAFPQLAPLSICTNWRFSFRLASSWRFPICGAPVYLAYCRLRRPFRFRSKRCGSFRMRMLTPLTPLARFRM